jgi:hypothetical protein
VVSEKSSAGSTGAECWRVRGGYKQAFERRKGPPDETSGPDFTDGGNLGVKMEISVQTTFFLVKPVSVVGLTLLVYPIGGTLA